VGTHLKSRVHLNPASYVGLQLALGLLILIGATGVFIAIAEDVVTGDPLTQLDVNVSNWLHARVKPPLITAMLLVSDLHSTPVIVSITIAIGIYLLWQKEKQSALFLGLSVFDGIVLNLLLKNIFHRGRPQLYHPILTLSSYGFPSGHTMLATVFYTSLAALLVSRAGAWRNRLLIIFVAGILILLVGFSRIYLGAHYLSDVLGAIAEGLAWVALCYTAVRLAWHWRTRS
jgi:membrane-associated phospholipid phosphatase